MQLEIKSLFSSDLAIRYNVIDVQKWKPNNIEDIYYGLEMEIGNREEESSNLFQTVVASPEGIRKHEKNLKNCLIGRRYFIVLFYNWKEIINEIQQIIDDCASDTWEESVVKLNRYFLWEYENHEWVGEEGKVG